jgi:hypothetical protein
MNNNDKLSEIFKRLKENELRNRCAVCNAYQDMDDETKQAFTDVMHSSVSIKAITDAITSEGLKLSRFQLGEARRECINGSRACPSFKAGNK